MRERLLPRLAAVVAWGLSSTAWALPWNVDLVDSDSIKAYERVMRPLPEKVMSQPNLLTPIAWRRNYVRESPEGQALVSPLDVASAKVQDLGGRMYNIYCTPCHGDGQTLGPVGAPGRFPAVAILSGPDGRLKLRSDGHVYLTIRNGGGLMPSYGWAMNDEEMWSVVAWMRKNMPDAAAPAPVASPAAPSDGAPPPTGATPIPAAPKAGGK